MTALDVLKLFNEQSERLHKSRFVNDIKQRKISMTIKKEKGKLLIDKKWPDKDIISGFILPLRFLIQDNERCSFRNMSRIYSNLDVPDELKQEFQDARKTLNDLLDVEFEMNMMPEGTITRREILEVFIYGFFAHSNLAKREIFDRWMRIPVVNDLLEFLFVDTILDISNLAFRVSESINKKAIDHLTSSTSG